MMPKKLLVFLLLFSSIGQAGFLGSDRWKDCRNKLMAQEFFQIPNDLLGLPRRLEYSDYSPYKAIRRMKEIFSLSKKEAHYLKHAKFAFGNSNFYSFVFEPNSLGGDEKATRAQEFADQVLLNAINPKSKILKNAKHPSKEPGTFYPENQPFPFSECFLMEI